MEGGTLQQLHNLIGRSNIGSETDVKGHVNEIEDFLELVVKCHMIEAALHFFSMSTIDDRPHSNSFPAGFASLPFSKRKALFFDRLYRIIDRYVIPKQFLLEQPAAEEMQPAPSDVVMNPHFQRVSHEHRYDAPPTSSGTTPRPLPPTIREALDSMQAPQSVQSAAVDGVFAYASAVLNNGLLLLEFKDAIREGDGPRILRCWKAFLLYFHFAKHHNYANEVVRMLATVHASATPRVAAQITWSRVVNTRGLAGHNIPVDLHNEQLNKALKQAVTGLGPNITQETILQCGKSLDGLLKVAKSFDQQHGLHPESLEHSAPRLAKDEKLIMDELARSRVFEYIPGREHRSFRGIKPNAAQKVDLKKITAWIQEKKHILQSEQNVSRLYKHSC